MESMSQKSLKTLEYDKVLKQLAACALSSPGREACLMIRPEASFEAAEAALRETDDALIHLLRKGELPLSAFDDVREILDFVGAGGVPGPASFLTVSRQLRLVERLRSERGGEDPEPQKEESLCLIRISQLNPLNALCKRIDACILNDEELKDEASPELFRLRRSISSLQQEVRRQLDKLIRNQADFLQDQLVTLRGERYVIPVKAEHKASVPGIIHDSSASGSTVFVEPMIVVELNNKIREARSAEREEITRILTELAAMLSRDASAVLENQRILLQLDVAQAKAKLAKKQKASFPQLNQEGRILLSQARHPLIPEEQVVPIDFELGIHFDTLVITGPNTGGKTVALKTCGLLTLMAMSGLFVPAKDGSELAFYSKILADIGDEQSIEQSLSTFSAHLKTLVSICAEADENTLILLDELGAGTDPSEGAALALATLEYLRRRGSALVATTHYQELKGYAMNSEGVSNACCEFDHISLRPTYRLLIGVPGVSNALAISSRLGLPQEIIDDARDLISDEGARFEELVSAIERSHQEAGKMKADIERLQQEAKEAAAGLESEKSRIEAERSRLLDEARNEAYAILREAEEKAESLLKELRLETERGRVSEEQKQALSEAADKMGAEIQREKLREAVKKELKPEEIQPGSYYKDLLSGFSGQACESPDPRGQILLRNGNISLRADIKNLIPATAESMPEKKSRSSRNSTMGRRSNTRSELYLLGRTVAEALSELDQYLDDAALVGLRSVRIVHGKGSGALRKAIREKLDGDPRCLSYDDAAFGEGDAGVTIAKLR